MLTDLSSTVLLACVVLVAIGAWFFVSGRRAAAGELPRGRVLGLQTRTLRSSRDAWDAGHAAAAPFLERYGRLIFTTTALTVIFTFLVDWLGAFFYVLALAVVALGLYVCLKKANAAASRVVASHDGHEAEFGEGDHDGATRLDDLDLDEVELPTAEHVELPHQERS